MQNSKSQMDDMWTVFDYEVMMFRNILAYKNRVILSDKQIQHIVQCSLTESLVLHTRILIEILISRGQRVDDITINKLLPNFASRNIDILKIKYGMGSEENSPCWIFNKLLAHASSNRTSRHDYSNMIIDLAPIIESILCEIKSNREN